MRTNNSLLHAGLLLFCSVIMGCDYYRFTIKSPDRVECRIFSDHHTVQYGERGFVLSDGATVGMQIYDRTQYRLKTTLRIRSWGGFSFLLRSVTEERIVDSGLIIHISETDGFTLDSAGITIMKNPLFRFPVDTLVAISVYNDEKYLEVVIGCDTIVKRSFSIPSSDYVVFQSNRKTILEVVSAESYDLQFTEGENVNVVSGEEILRN